LTKLLPAKHLLLIAAVCLFLAIVLIAFPEKKTTNNAISLEAKFEQINQSELTFADIEELKPQVQTISNDFKPDTFSSIYDLPTPEALRKKNSPPSYVDKSIEIKAGDSLSKVLTNEGISNQDIYKVSQADKKKKSLVRMLPGQTINFTKNKNTGELTKLTLVINRLKNRTYLINFLVKLQVFPYKEPIILVVLLM